MEKTKYTWLLVHLIQKYVHHVDYGLHTHMHVHTHVHVHAQEQSIYESFLGLE